MIHWFVRWTRPIQRSLLLLLLPPLVLGGCGTTNGTRSAAPAVDAAPTVETSVPAPSTASTASATAVLPAVEPAGANATGDVLPTLRVATDSYPGYYPLLLIQALGLMEQRGFHLELIPLYMDEKNAESDDERFAKLQQGEWDVLATPLDAFAKRADPSVGAVTAVLSESAGGDKIVARAPIATVNDLRGQRVAVPEGKVSEFLLRGALALSGLRLSDVTLIGRPDVGGAVRAYLEGEADAVVGWEPDILPAERQGTVLLSSNELRLILDVLVSSRSAIDTKTPALQALHEAYFDALRILLDEPERAAQALLQWGNPEWTLLQKEDDVAAQLQNVAQATLAHNKLVLDAALLPKRIAEAHALWNPQAAALTFDAASALSDGQFVQGALRVGALASQTPPVNPTFLLTGGVAAASQTSAATPVAQLPLDMIMFEPESVVLTPATEAVLRDEVAPILRTARMTLLIEGSAGWPGPAGTFSAAQIADTALARATTVAAFLGAQGVDPQRIAIATTPSQCPDCLDPTALARDRFVRLTLLRGGR